MPSRAVEAGIHFRQVDEAADEQCRAHHEHHRQRDLGNDQRARNASKPLAVVPRPPSRSEIERRSFKCSSGASPKITPVMMAVTSVKPRTGPSSVTLAARGIASGLMLIIALTPARQACSNDRRDGGQQQSLGNELPQQPRPGRAQRRPDGKLPVPGFARANSRLARFAQAMSRTKTTAA